MRLINSLIQEEVQEFLDIHKEDDVKEFMLRAKPVAGVAPALLAQQINGRQRAKLKLPSWSKNGVVFPPSLNIEQSSSEITAQYKAGLLQTLVPKLARGADLTGGFGIDAWFLASIGSLEYVEADSELAAIAAHNHGLLGKRLISYHKGTAEQFLEENPGPFDFIYLDPSRRKAGQKRFLLEECSPDIVNLQDKFFSLSPLILVKTSPLFDLSRGCRQLRNVSKAIVVSVDNECKELLFLLQRGYTGEPNYVCVDLYSRTGETAEYTFTAAEERSASIQFSDPLTYLYEPSASLLKAGAFKLLAQKYFLYKLAPNSHLYTSSERVAFPGKTFEVLESVKPDKTMKKKFAGGQANVITRNYPLRSEEIKKKTGLTDGGNLYLICTRGLKENFVLIAKRL